MYFWRNKNLLNKKKLFKYCIDLDTSETPGGNYLNNDMQH